MVGRVPGWPWAGWRAGGRTATAAGKGEGSDPHKSPIGRRPEAARGETGAMADKVPTWAPRRRPLGRNGGWNPLPHPPPLTFGGGAAPDGNGGWLGRGFGPAFLRSGPPSSAE